MLRHIVMWKVKNENKTENLQKMKKDLEGLKLKISSILDIEVGISEDLSVQNTKIFDIVLNSTFENKSELENYKKNPYHIEVENFIKQITIDKAAVDFEVF